MSKKPLFYSKHVIEKSLKHHVVEWIATAGSLTGVWMVANQLRMGFMVWLVANILWIWFSFTHRHWGLLFLSACYLVINAYAFLTWI